MTDSNNQTPDIELTDDGSHTLYSPQYDQHYHNPNGAVAESRHVFFEKNGLLAALPHRTNLTILETGFGTGLNLLLLADYATELNPKCTIDYYSVEAYPLDSETAGSLNFAEFLKHPGLAHRLSEIFENLKPGLNSLNVRENLSLHLFVGFFDAFEPKGVEADFLFHDPFSPGVNDELWTGEIFKKLASWSSRDAVLSTYSAATMARGAMAWAGWHVAREQGALGKREMTVASLNPEKLSHLERVNEQYLAQRYISE